MYHLNMCDLPVEKTETIFSEILQELDTRVYLSCYHFVTANKHMGMLNKALPASVCISESQ